MNRTKRRILFWAATLVFIIFTPLIIGYARGYRFDFEHFRISQVGAILLESEPDGAIVIVDSETTNRQTPTAMSNLLPLRTYSLTLELAGYQPWRKELLVEPSRITRVENIILAPEVISLTRIPATSTPILRASFSPSGETALVITDNPAGPEIFVLNVDSGNIEPIVFSDATPTLRIASPSWRENGNEVVFVRETIAGPIWYRFDRSRGQLTDLTTEWQVARAARQNTITTGLIPNELTADELIFGSGGLLIARFDETAFIFDSALGTIETLAINRIGAITATPNRIFVATDDRELFELAADGSIRAQYGELQFIPTTLSLSPDGQVLAYYDNLRLGLVWIETSSDQPMRTRGEQEIIFESESPIQVALWHEDSRHMFVFLESKKLVFAETDIRGGYQHWQWDFAGMQTFAYTASEQSLWFLDSAGALFRSVEKL